MARFIKGDVVVLNFPFSDLTRTKRRPALVITALTGDDVILCQITSQVKFDSYAIKLDNTDFESGGLNQSSRIRPNRLFTADAGIILYSIGRISDAKLLEVVDRLIAMLGQD